MNVLVRLLKKNYTQRVERNGLVVVRDVTIPGKISGLHKKGPKFNLEPNVLAHELLAISRKIASKTDSEERECCLLAGVDSLTRTIDKGSSHRYRACTKEIVAFYNASDLRLLEVDKEGGFVVMKAKDFHEKAGQAVLKNFFQQRRRRPRQRPKLHFCVRTWDFIDLPRTSVIVGTAAWTFFSVQTHKEGIPFRSIVTERNSWQQHVSRFLQKHLNSLDTRDPFGTKSSLSVIEFLGENHAIGYAFSVDVQDLFYSVPQKEMFIAVSNGIEDNGVVAFQNLTGMALESFMSLLEFFLGATLVSFDNALYVQRRGVCIG